MTVLSSILSGDLGSLDGLLAVYLLPLVGMSEDGGFNFDSLRRGVLIFFNLFGDAVILDCRIFFDERGVDGDLLVLLVIGVGADSKLFFSVLAPGVLSPLRLTRPVWDRLDFRIDLGVSISQLIRYEMQNVVLLLCSALTDS